MNTFPFKEETYRVILKALKANTEEEKIHFCQQVSERYGIPIELLKRMVDRCPIVIRKDLSLKKAEMLALAFQSYGASVTIEKRRATPPIFLEFTPKDPNLLSLQSTYLHKTTGGMWQVLGRVKNRSTAFIEDLWVMIQFFDVGDELLLYEESPLPINPLSPSESSPFKVFVEGNLPIQKITIAFKNASGAPISTIDERDHREWVPVELDRLETKDIPFSRHGEAQVPSPLSERTFVDVPEKKEEWLEEGEEKEELEQARLPEVEDLKIDQEELASHLIGQTKLSSDEEKPIEETLGESQHSEVLHTSIGTTLQEEEELHLDDWQKNEEEALQSSESFSPSSEDTAQGIEEKAEDAGKDQEEKPISYPWMDLLRKAIELEQERVPDPFILWFDKVQQEGGFESRYHALCTLLIYARFHQTPPSDNALSNTQKVYRLSHRKDFSSHEIPALDGALFFPGEVWRDLFIRAIPKLQEVSEQILNKKDWELTELDRLIRIIPHMTAQNSRWTLRVLHARFPEIGIDLSTMGIEVNEAIYRVLSRLGVLHPLFDYYQGKHSIGDRKIQAFAQAVYSDDPVKIEEPLTRLGNEGERGLCLPEDPQCPSCPFESFCPKLYLGFNPSEKGMLARP